MAALQGYTLGLYDELQAESEESLGLHRTGAIYLAGDEGWAEWFGVEQARALTAGVVLRNLDPAELRERAPIVDGARVARALFDAADGHLDPAGTTRAFAAGARRRGVTIERQCPVTALSPRPGGWAVGTPNGTILAETVVVAAGLWAREVAALAGIALPVLPMEHQYLLTEPVADLRGAPELPTIADFLSGSYLRQEGQGLLYGTYEQEPRHWSPAGTPGDFGMELLPPDLDRLAPNLERAAERVPCLATTGIRRVVNGPLVVSPDGNPVVGPVAPGLFVAAGVLAGFSQCGGIGLALANWIADGEPGMDVWGMDAARFGPWATPGFVRARTREVYERRYALTKPNEHLAAARPLRTTPLHDRLRDAGAAWGAQSGWEYPTHFPPPGTPPERPSWTRSDAWPHVRAECLAVRDAAGLFETSAYAKLHVEGPGALAWLQAMTCNALPPRPMRVGLMPLVSPSGRLAGDLTVTTLGPDAALLIGSPQAEALYVRMLSAPPPGIRVGNLTEDWGGLGVSGPEAPGILRALGIEMPPFGAAWVDVGAACALAIRVSFTGEAGAEVYARASVLRHVHDAVLAAGRAHGLRLIGVSALDSLRLEKLYPSPLKIVLLNPPHRSIGSRVPGELLPPLGLLMVGGPLIDAGHDVRLVNADLAPMSVAQILAELRGDPPQALLLGHSGSTSAHPVALEITAAVRAAWPAMTIVYGGVFPTYHWAEVLREAPEIDVIVRGEGEATTPALIEALASGRPLDAVPGLAFRRAGEPFATPPAPMLRSLDDARVGWELVDFARHSYWGGKRAVVMQFSRGCPHLCTYCGQRGFWTQWRHRDPAAFAKEVAWLHREKGVELVNLADENPTSSRRAWKAFLEALVAEDVPVLIVGSTRADDIVRDADLLPLYKKAGCLRFLLGLEGTDEATLRTVRKGGTRAKDREAIRLLRAHGMVGLCTFAVGFEEEADADYWRLLRHLLAYDPDQVMSVFATPHRWTPFHGQSAHRRVIQTDLRLWDYKHQVLETPRVPAWRVFLWVKLIEAVLQLRPKALWRAYLQPDPTLRHAQRWYTRMGRGVWLREVRDALLHRSRPGPTVAEFWGREQLPEQALARQRRASH